MDDIAQNFSNCYNTTIQTVVSFIQSSKVYNEKISITDWIGLNVRTYISSGI